MIKIKFRHEYDLLTDFPDDYHGQKIYWGTHCRICDDGVELATGLAILSPKDKFSKPVGRAISFYRALKSISNRNIRKQVAGLVDAKTLKMGRELVDDGDVIFTLTFVNG